MGLLKDLAQVMGNIAGALLELIMSDVACPYCKTEQEINHDDGYGYVDGEDYEQHCRNCDKYFIFTTSLSISYTVQCQEDDHIMEPFGDKWPNMYDCINCDHFEKIEEELEEAGDS